MSLKCSASKRITRQRWNYWGKLAEMAVPSAHSVRCCGVFVIIGIDFNNCQGGRISEGHKHVCAEGVEILAPIVKGFLQLTVSSLVRL